MALQFYRVGKDIFEANTNRHIGPTEWQKSWTGKAQEVSAPNQKAPVESGSLEGTLPSMNRSLPGDVPAEGNDFALAMKQIARSAYGNRTGADTMQQYQQAGLNIQNPTLISNAISSETERRSGTVVDIYNSTMSMIKEQETQRAAKEKEMRAIGSGILQNMLATPFASQLTGKDFEDIVNGGMSDELLVKWGEYLKTTPNDGKAPTMEDIDGDGQLEQWDTSTRTWIKPQSGDVGSSADFNKWLSDWGVEPIQSYDTPVSYFKDGRKTHGGYDITGTLNSPVTSPISGKVVEAQSTPGWGTTVVIEDANGNKWRMAHFNDVNVKMGESVTSGQKIGLMGNTGYVLKGDGTAPSAEELAAGRGVHLHLEVKDKNGNLIDPKTFQHNATDIADNSEAMVWARQVVDKELTMAQVMDEIGKNSKMKIDVMNAVAKLKGTSASNLEATMAFQDKLGLIDEIEDNKKGLLGSVGTYALKRWSPVTIDKSERMAFKASVHRLTDKETLDALLNLKKAGGTLGALSDTERLMLQNSATKLKDWEIKDDKGNGIGRWEVSREIFMEEVNRIKKIAQSALIAAGGDDGIISVLEQTLSDNPQLINEYNALAALNPGISEEDMIQLLGIK